ncbi:MAG TPA: hypothetical protein VFS07_02120 [Gemmatimonadales bacterium]|jgi:acyl carrier protein|nr:hypothetical protein [Gemmatimonadales bacterium]
MTAPALPDRAAIVDAARQWIRENFLYMRPDWPLTEETELLRGGVVDSVGVVELVGWLETTWHLTIPESEITEAHLGTLGAIADYVRERLASGEGSAAWPRQVA